MPTMVERLAALGALSEAGWLTPAEFGRAKARIIAEGDLLADPVLVPQAPPGPAPYQARPLSPRVTGIGLALGAATAAAGGMAAGGLGG